MIAFRRAHPMLSQGQFYTEAEIHWFGSEGGLPNWTNPKEKQFACLIHEDGQSALYLMFNAGADAIDFSSQLFAAGKGAGSSGDGGRSDFKTV